MALLLPCIPVLPQAFIVPFFIEVSHIVPSVVPCECRFVSIVRFLGAVGRDVKLRDLG